jgi:hypothetical protein
LILEVWLGIENPLQRHVQRRKEVLTSSEDFAHGDTGELRGA